MSDIEIARQCRMKPIAEVAEAVGITGGELELYGHYKAKVGEEAIRRLSGNPDGRLVLVTAINPTPAGEGKTTTTVGLGMGLCRLGRKAVVALREPSLGPVFGLKGGAAGGGRSQVVPMEDINLHFTGDMHAVTAANNLLCALIDNHMQQGNALDIDSRRILFRRCMDMNDRVLREIVVGLGGKANGIPREDGFQITVASEVMAILCLARDVSDLKKRLGRILVAYNRKGEPVRARDLSAAGAMAALLRDAFKPNLVQTLEHTPALIHGGPFANIAHGCNSVRATRLALGLGDYAVTEAGFGSDLGAEKFFDIKCRAAGLTPSAVVLVATARALKYNGGVEKKKTGEPNLTALRKGLPNLGAHIDNIRQFGVPVVVALNRFETDSDEELEAIAEYCAKQGADFALSEVFARGGEGALALAQKVVEACDKQGRFEPLYHLALPIDQKIEAIATKVYGAAAVEYSLQARRGMDAVAGLGGAGLPVCVAKTQYSLSDNASLLGRPSGFTLRVQDVRLAAGAGFIIVLTGDIMTMPGLPGTPAAANIDVDGDGNISGLF